MAKRRPKKRRHKAPDHSQKPRADRGTRALEDRTWKQPVLGGSHDRNRAWTYLQRFMTFEMAILNNNIDDLDTTSIPHEHYYLLTRWPDAFGLFRHAMWSYFERVIGMNPWTATLRSLMIRARAADPDGFERFDEAITTALPRFQVQRNNVLHQIQEDASPNARERHRAMIQLYSDMYEIDFPLWLLGVLGQSYRRGVVDPTSFGGPSTVVAQASLIDAVSTAAAGTPLEPLLKTAYIPALRNSINHNAYEVLFAGKDGDGFAGIRDSDSGDTWEADAVMAAWRATADLTNAAMSTCASVSEMTVPSSHKMYARLPCGRDQLRGRRRRPACNRRSTVVFP